MPIATLSNENQLTGTLTNNPRTMGTLTHDTRLTGTLTTASRLVTAFGGGAFSTAYSFAYDVRRHGVVASAFGLSNESRLSGSLAIGGE